MAVFPTGAVHRPVNNYVWDTVTLAWVVETQPGGSGSGTTTIADGVTSSILATVLDLANSNPLTVAITDGAGTQITSFGGGTQYTEDTASVADPTGTQLIARRRDALVSETTTDGDVTAVNSTAKGELYVKQTDAVPVTDNAGSLTVDNTTLSVVGGGVEATAQRVTIASDSTGVLSVDDNGGSLTVDGETTSSPATSAAGLITRPLPRVFTATGLIQTGTDNVTVALDGCCYVKFAVTDGVGATFGTIQFLVSYDGGANYVFTSGQSVGLHTSTTNPSPTSSHNFITNGSLYTQYLFNVTGASHFKVSIFATLSDPIECILIATDSPNAVGAQQVTQGRSFAAVTQAWFAQLSDNITGPVAVKAASTAAVATDKALVVAISPNKVRDTSSDTILILTEQLYLQAYSANILALLATEPARSPQRGFELR